MTELPPNFLQLAVAGKRIAFGGALLKWGVKGLVSEQKAVVTGLAPATYVVAQMVGGSAGFVVGIVSVVGGTVTLEARSLVGEFAAGTEVACHWIAIET